MTHRWGHSEQTTFPSATPIEPAGLSRQPPLSSMSTPALSQLCLDGLHLVGLLPGKPVASEVPVAGGFLVDGPLQIERVDDPLRGQVEDLVDRLFDLLVGNLSRAERGDEERDGLWRCRWRRRSALRTCRTGRQPRCSLPRSGPCTMRSGPPWSGPCPENAPPPWRAMPP